MRRVFDRYEYEPANVIGMGGMGTVYKGYDTADGLTVAIKHLKPDVIHGNPDMVTRFQREGEALRELNHPNIVKVLAAGNCENDHYLIMEYVTGGSLQDLIDKQPQLIVQRALYIALDLADALTRAHRLSILHRDIKPANVLLADDGTPRLTDFGVARVQTSDMTQEGQLVGTLAYLSPESLTGGMLDERHDIWAFGVLLFEMLTGRRPFESESIGKLITDITTQPIPDIEAMRPDLPIALVDLLYRMLDRNPDTRIRSVRQVGAELESIIHGGDLGGGLLISTGQGRFQTTGAIATPTPSPISTSTQPQVPQLHNFPAPATPFVGRTREVNEVIKLINDPEQRLITLTGAGGMGKTRIAIAVAEAVLGHFPDGAYFVPLAAITEHKDVPNKLAEVMGFQFSGTTDPKTELKAFLADKQALIVLDNLEHLVEGAEMLADGLGQMRGITLLVTSRERLRLRGEQVYEVGGMVLPPKDITVEDMGSYPATQLFITSARRSAPDFVLDEETAPHVCKVLGHVGGVPLAIELAAGWLEMLDAEEVAQEIEQSLDFLETDMRDMPERHRSLRAVFDYSWNLMNEDERNAFMKLSVFRGGFERNAAKQVMGTSLRTLTALMNKSLLSRQADGRYSVSKLLRQYAQEQFDTQCDTGEDVYTAYIAYYAAFIEKIAPTFNSKHDLKAVAAMDAELENVRHAWKMAAEREQFDTLAQIVTPLADYYTAHSMMIAAIETFGGLADQMRSAGQTDHRLYWMAYTHHMETVGRAGNYRETEKGTREILSHLRENSMGDKLLARVLNVLAYPLMMLGQYDEARRLLYEAGGLIRKDDPSMVATLGLTTGNLGYMEFLAGNLHEAQHIYEDLLESYYSMDYSPIGHGFACNNLGEILQAMGQLDEAKGYYERAYAIFKQYQHQRGMAFTTNNLAGVAILVGDNERAAKLYRKAYRIHREIGDLSGIGHSLSALANMSLFKDQNYRDALGYYQQALDLRRNTGDRLNYGRTLTEMATANYLMGDFDTGKKYAEEALDVAESLNNDLLRALAYMSVGGSLLYEKREIEGMNYLKQATVIMRREEYAGNIVFMLVTVVVTLGEFGYDEKAAQIIGYLEAHESDKFEAFAAQILNNTRHALQGHLGGAYKVAHAKGGRHTLDSLLSEVLVP